MEILGIGPSELIFIIIIALIVLGPKDMQKAGRTLGKWLRRVVTSDGWKLFQQTSREIQTLPNRLMRDAALDELKELQKDLKQPLEPDHRIIAASAAATPPATSASESENKILPAASDQTPASEDQAQDA
jgi:sec-independent protein translocase protein TatB